MQSTCKGTMQIVVDHGEGSQSRIMRSNFELNSQIIGILLSILIIFVVVRCLCVWRHEPSWFSIFSPILFLSFTFCVFILRCLFSIPVPIDLKHTRSRQCTWTPTARTVWNNSIGRELSMIVCIVRFVRPIPFYWVVFFLVYFCSMFCASVYCLIIAHEW